MTAAGTSPLIAIIEIVGLHFILPAVLCLAMSEGMRKLGWIKNGDMRITAQ